jgi:hypothetical protein
MMDKIFPGILAGVIVLAIGFVVFYFFVEHYAKRRLRGNDSIDEKLKKLDDVLPLIDDIMKKGIVLEKNISIEYIGSEDDKMLAREIEISTNQETVPVPEDIIEPEAVQKKESQTMDGKPNDIFSTLYEKL